MRTSPLSPVVPYRLRAGSRSASADLAAVSYSIRHSVRSRRSMSLRVGAQGSYSYGEPQSSAMASMRPRPVANFCQDWLVSKP
jgi:hypothetical protein